MVLEAFDFLGSLPFFSRLDAEHLLSLASNAIAKPLVYHSHLVKLGEPADSVFVVAAGAVKVTPHAYSSPLSHAAIH
jgi:CRP-like cAMP-binding protein